MSESNMTSAPVLPSPTWYGAKNLGLTFGSENIARGPGGELRYTVIPLPVTPPQDVTMAVRADALVATYTGRLQGAVDLYRLTVERNGWMRGILDTMAHGLLGLPLSWQGDPAMVSALSDADGTPGDYQRMFPEAECAKIFSDGVGIGLGLGQFVLMCWRCDSVEWDAVGAPGQTTEICRTCRARRIDRPAGMRQLFQLRWRDARWLWRIPTTLQWYYTGRQGAVEVHAGNGEWFLFQTVPDLDIWAHGPLALGTEAAIFARDSRYDRQNTSAACAPAHVFQATGPTDPKTRRDVENQAEGLRFGNSLTLPGEWKHEIHAASADYVDVTSAIVSDTADLWEVCITGNRMGTQSGTGFANMDIYARATRERRRYYAGAWIRQIRAQGLTWYALENFGTRNAPVGVYDTRSPEDKLAGAKADEQEGAALKSLRDGLDAVGYELDPAYLEERSQARGIRIRQKANGHAAGKLSLGVEAVMACVRGAPALANLGLDPFGDERDDMTLTELANIGKTSGKASPAPALPASPAAPGAAQTPPATPPDARVEKDDEDDYEDEDEAARLATEYTEAGLDRCPYHGRTHACPRCGVRRVYGLDPVTRAPRVAWRPIRRVVNG